MSNFRKASYVLANSPDWVQILTAASIYEGVEYTDRLGLNVTIDVCEDIHIDPNTNVIDVDGVSDTAVVVAIRKYSEANTPPPVDQVTVPLDELTLNKIEELTETVDNLKNQMVARLSNVENGVAQLERTAYQNGSPNPEQGVLL